MASTAYSADGDPPKRRRRSKNGKHNDKYNGIKMADSYELSLSRVELQYLESLLHDKELLAEYENDKKSATRWLILRIGLEIKNDNVALCFAEEELWLLRELVSIYTKMGDKAVGLDLKQKIYKQLGIAELRRLPQHYGITNANKSADKDANGDPNDIPYRDAIARAEESDAPTTSVPRPEEADSSTREETVLP